MNLNILTLVENSIRVLITQYIVSLAYATSPVAKDRPGSLFQPGPGPGPGSAKSAGTGILPGPGL